MSAKIRRYIREKEDFEFNRGYNDNELQASKLRKNFLRKFIIDFDTNLYKTQQERDWAYICKREFNYDVRLKSAGYAGMVTNAVFSWRIFRNRGMVFWPLAVVPGIAYNYFWYIFLQKHNKKLFDMCNVGEEYYLGKKRNEVLEKCNQILDTEDF